MPIEPPNHDDSCDCYACKYGMGQMVEWEQNALDEHGWYTHLVKDDSDSPTGFNAHTHFLWENYKHLDIQIVLPLAPQLVMNLLHTVADRIKAGEKFTEGEEYDKIIKGHKVRFLLTTEDGTPAERVGDRWQMSHMVLRMILPTPNGSLYAWKMDGPDTMDANSSKLYKAQEQTNFEMPDVST